jgi:hypothetical protein
VLERCECEGGDGRISWVGDLLGIIEEALRLRGWDEGVVGCILADDRHWLL